VMLTSPLVPTLPTVFVCEKGDAVYFVIFPVVGLVEVSMKTCSTPERNQFCRIVWSASAEVTSREMLCAFPSARIGTKGVRSRKYVGRSRAPYEVMGLCHTESDGVGIQSGTD